MNAVEQGLSTPDTSVAPVCVSCGSIRTGSYCAQCGQRALAGRHTLRSMLGGALSRIMDLDSGLLHTVHRLTISPGRVIRDYLAGRTIYYTHPAAYLLIALAAFVITTAPELDGTTGGAEARVFVIVAVPFVAAASRLLFWRSRLGYAEHLILVLYVLAHVALFFALLFLLFPLLSDTTQQILLITALVLSATYVSWTYSRVMPARPLLAAAGGLLAWTAGSTLWMVALMLLLNALYG